MEKKIKVGIYTFIAANNYGAVLQAFALKQYLCDQGCDAYCMDYRPGYLADKYVPFSLCRLNQKGSFIRNLLKEILLYRGLKRKNELFENFRKKNLNLSLDNERNFDYYIVGSDQVWNYEITQGDSVFLGDIPNARNNIITYAASMEKGMAPEYCGDFRNRLKNFFAISVREESLKNKLKVDFDQQSTLVVDPTFLLSAKDWHRFGIPYSGYDQNYVFMYGFGFTEKEMNAVRIFADKKGLSLIVATSGVKYKKHYKNDISPEQFVYLIEHAAYVVTNSFHGTAYSVIFEKNYLQLPKKGQKRSIRVENLLKLLGVKAESENICDGVNMDSFISLTFANQKLHDAIESSKEFLKLNLINVH